MDIDEASLAMPKSENAEPNLAKDLSDNEAPRCT